MNWNLTTFAYRGQAIKWCFSILSQTSAPWPSTRYWRLSPDSNRSSLTTWRDSLSVKSSSKNKGKMVESSSSSSTLRSRWFGHLPRRLNEVGQSSRGCTPFSTITWIAYKESKSWTGLDPSKGWEISRKESLVFPSSPKKKFKTAT